MKCKICEQEMKTITWRHLKKHNITVNEYQEKYGPTESKEQKKYRSKMMSGSNNPNFGNKLSDKSKEIISKKAKGRTPYNKGKSMTDEQKQKLSLKAKERNQKWNEAGTHPNVGKTHSEETKLKIKEARAKQIIKPSSIQKALQTKKEKGYDFAFFKGKTHSKESKKKISESSKKTAEKKRKEAQQKAIQRANTVNVTIKSFVGNYANMVCNACDTEFTFTSQYLSESKINDSLCPTCNPRYENCEYSASQGEKDITTWLKATGVDNIVNNSRSIIKPLELDIYLPDYNLAIEYCGLYWHSELKGKDKDYHKIKYQMCQQKGIKLLTIFDIDWNNKQDIVKSRILNQIGLTKNKIQARKCQIKQITANEANQFLNQNHIQGSGRSNIRYGAYFNNQLVSVMTFSDSNISRKINQWEINRYANLIETSITGIASRLFKRFIQEFDPEYIISFADLRWSSDKAFYPNLGFKLESISPPNYWYFDQSCKKLYHRYSLRKNKDDNQLLTEWQNRQKQGWNRIWDCGHAKFIWSKNKGS